MIPRLVIKLSPAAEQTLSVVQTLPQNILLGIARAMDRANLLTVSDIQRKYLSFPAGGPSSPIGLRRKSGRYRDSLRASKSAIVGTTVVSGIGTNIVSKHGVSYPAVHEFGATIPAHDITASGKALKFKIGQRTLFRKKVHIPEIHLPARAPIQRGIQDNAANYGKAISAEVQKVWEGK